MPRLITAGIKHTKMQSRMTIEVDFENGNQPVIQILRRNSHDVRDQLVSAFFERLEHGSTWAKIKFKDYFIGEPGGPSVARYYLEAITPDQFKEEGEVMLEQHRVNEAYKKSPTQSIG